MTRKEKRELMIKALKEEYDRLSKIDTTPLTLEELEELDGK